MKDPDLTRTMAEVAELIAELIAALDAARCAVTGCGRATEARGWCAAHYTRWRRTGDPCADLPIGPRQAPNPDSYSAVRRRIRRQRGPASALACTDCSAVARDWSYDHSDPHELTDPDRGYRYSTDSARYVPRCRSCHRRATRRGSQLLDSEHCAQLYRDGRTLAAIAQLTGHSTAEIRRLLVTNGTPINHSRRRQRRTHPQHRATQPITTP